MSRSKRKTKIFGIANSTSEKEDKQIAHRKFRRKQKTILASGGEEYNIPIKMKEVINVWSMSKDGKQYWHKATEKDMRK